MQITDAMRADVLERSSRRCECLSANCRHRRKGSRCPRGLRGLRGLREGQWKIYCRTESAGANLWNLEAWCVLCFENNYG